MEKAVGEKFRFKGYTLVVVEDASSKWEDSCGACVTGCRGCNQIIRVAGSCDGDLREDGKSVHFEHFGVDF